MLHRKLIRTAVLCTLLSFFSNICSAQRCWEFYFYFHLFGENGQSVTDLSSRYKFLNSSNMHSYDYILSVPDRNKFYGKESKFHNWYIFQCSPWDYMYFIAVDTRKNDTMKVFYKKASRGYTYKADSVVRYSRLADSIPFMKGNFIVDGNMPRHTYKEWKQFTAEGGRTEDQFKLEMGEFASGKRDDN